MAGIEGKCNCGAVTLEISGDPKAAFFCHCDDCQKVHSAAAVPIVMFAADDVRVKGDVLTWQLHVTPRVTCATCGTRLFMEPPGMGVRGVAANVLPPGTFSPMFHVQCAFSMAPVKDALPHFKGFPESFGGSDDVVDW